MEKKFKCKTPECPEYVTLVLKGGVGAFMINDLDRYITINNNSMEIASEAILDDKKTSKKMSFDSEENSTLSLNLRQGYTAEAALKCPQGHENYYKVEVI